MVARGDFVEFADDFGPSLTDFTDSVTLKKFDPNLGELFKVTYTLDATIAGEVSADSENPATRTVTLEVAGSVKVKEGAATLLEVSPFTSSGPIDLDPDNDAFPGFIGTDATTFPAVLVDSTFGTAVDAPTLNWFTATFLDETFSWDIEATGDSRAISSANFATLISQFASGTVTVRYDYNAVIPETSTYLSGLGLLGVAALAGRRLIRRR